MSFFAGKKKLGSKELAAKKALSELGIDDESVPQQTWSRLHMPVRSGSFSDITEAVRQDKNCSDREPTHQRTISISSSLPSTQSPWLIDDQEVQDNVTIESLRNAPSLRRRSCSITSTDSMSCGLDDESISDPDDTNDLDELAVFDDDLEIELSMNVRSRVSDGPSQQKNGCYAATLPNELLEKIFVMTGDHVAIGRIAQVCRQWHAVATSSFIQNIPAFQLRIRFAKYKTGQAVPDVLARTESSVTALAIAPDSGLIYSATGNGVQVFSETGKPLHVLQGHSESVAAIAVGPEGTVYTGSFDKTIKVWSPDGKEVQTFIGHTGSVRALAISPCGKVLYSGGHDRIVRIWDLDNPQEPRMLTGHHSGVYALAVSPSGDLIYSGAGSKDSRIHVWSKSGELVRVLNGHRGGIFSLACGPTGQLYSGSVDKTVRIWTAAGNYRTIHGHRFTVQALAVRDNRLYSGSIDSTVRVSNATTGAYIQTFTKHSGPIAAIAIASSGRVITGAQDKSLLLW